MKSESRPGHSGSTQGGVSSCFLPRGHWRAGWAAIALLVCWREFKVSLNGTSGHLLDWWVSVWMKNPVGSAPTLLHGSCGVWVPYSLRHFYPSALIQYWYLMYVFWYFWAVLSYRRWPHWIDRWAYLGLLVWLGWSYSSGNSIPWRSIP